MLQWTLEYVSFSVTISSGYMPSGIAEPYGSFIPIFLMNCHTVLHSGCISLHSLFSTSSPTCIVCRFFDDGYSDLCEVISHCSFDLRFSNNKWCWVSFHVFISHPYVFFGKMSVLSLLPIFWLGCLFFWYWACVFCRLVLCQLFHLLFLSVIL